MMPLLYPYILPLVALLMLAQVSLLLLLLLSSPSLHQIKATRTQLAELTAARLHL